jgi:hypothetical protein
MARRREWDSNAHAVLSRRNLFILRFAPLAVLSRVAKSWYVLGTWKRCSKKPVFPAFPSGCVVKPVLGDI